MTISLTVVYVHIYKTFTLLSDSTQSSKTGDPEPAVFANLLFGLSPAGE